MSRAKRSGFRFGELPHFGELLTTWPCGCRCSRNGQHDARLFIPGRRPGQPTLRRQRWSSQAREFEMIHIRRHQASTISSSSGRLPRRIYCPTQRPFGQSSASSVSSLRRVTGSAGTPAGTVPAISPYQSLTHRSARGRVHHRGKVSRAWLRVYVPIKKALANGHVRRVGRSQVSAVL
jgi:hypothetical protein